MLETTDQLVSRFIGGLLVQFQDVLNLFSPVSISEAHQRAVLLERQFNRRPTGPFVSSQPCVDLQTQTTKDIVTTAANRAPMNTTTSGSTRPGACFSCGGFGHRQTSCPRRIRTLIADEIGENDQLDTPLYDEEQSTVIHEEFVDGDVGQALVLRRACLAPKQSDNEAQRNQLFESTCTINGKVCRFIIDSGSCENVIATDAVNKLALTSEMHPKPYSLAWLQGGNNITVDRRVLVNFLIGSKYVDSVWCDIVPMDACHLLLGRLWKFDRSVLHDGRNNTYNLIFPGLKLVLRPTLSTPIIPSPKNQVLILKHRV